MKPNIRTTLRLPIATFLLIVLVACSNQETPTPATSNPAGAAAATARPTTEPATAAGQEAGATSEPGALEPTLEATLPTVTPEAEATDEPVATETTGPAVTEAPAATAEPEATEAPVPTVAPTATEVLEAIVNTKLNLNTVTEEQLLATIPGFGERMVREFFEYRPYISIQQFRREIGKYVSAEQVAQYEQFVYVPVDINESDAATLMQMPEVDETIAATLIAGRPYASNDAFLEALALHIPAVGVAAASGYLVVP